MDKNPARHYYLYAKGYYKEEGSFEMDLRKIQSHYCSVPTESLSMQDVNIILQQLAYSHIKYEHEFFEFMDRIRRNMHYPTFELAVAQACLIVLALTKVTDIPFDLGKADSTILPLHNRKVF
jgi:hypothetical protein